MLAGGVRSAALSSRGTHADTDVFKRNRVPHSALSVLEMPQQTPYVCDHCSLALFYVLHVVEAYVIGMISAGGM